MAYKLGEIHNGIKSTNGKVDEIIVEVKKINGGLSAEIQRSKLADASLEDRLDGLEKIPINSNQVTFRWMLEKLALPVVMLVVGGAIALLFN